MRWLILMACLVFGGCSLPPDFWTRPIYPGAGKIKNGCRVEMLGTVRRRSCTYQRKPKPPGYWRTYPPIESYVKKPARSRQKSKRHRHRRRHRHR